MPYFYAIFGSETYSQISWSIDDNKESNKRNMWVLTGLLVAPLFSLVSHTGYIIMASIAEPSKATETFFLGVGSTLLLFFVFRQCYVINKDSEKGLFTPLTETKYEAKFDQKRRYCWYYFLCGWCSCCWCDKPHKDKCYINLQEGETCCERIPDWCCCCSNRERCIGPYVIQYTRFYNV